MAHASSFGSKGKPTVESVGKVLIGNDRTSLDSLELVLLARITGRPSPHASPRRSTRGTCASDSSDGCARPRRDAKQELVAAASMNVDMDMDSLFQTACCVLVSRSDMEIGEVEIMIKFHQKAKHNRS